MNTLRKNEKRKAEQRKRIKDAKFPETALPGPKARVNKPDDWFEIADDRDPYSPWTITRTEKPNVWVATAGCVNDIELSDDIDFDNEGIYPEGPKLAAVRREMMARAIAEAKRRDRGKGGGRRVPAGRVVG